MSFENQKNFYAKAAFVMLACILTGVLQFLVIKNNLNICIKQTVI